MKKQETEGKTFLNILTETLTGAREAPHAPDADVEPGEQVIGILANAQVQALYSLRVTLAEHLVKFKGAMPDERPSDDEVRKLQVRGSALATQYQIVNHLLWEGVHTEFPQSRDPRVGVGLRKGWSVIIFKNTGMSTGDIIQRLLGGMFD